MHPYLAYIEDRDKYGDLQEGVYRGRKWLARRIPKMHHWCGYVEETRELTENEINGLGHCGLTGAYDGMPGFDCTHGCDYNPSNHEFYLRGIFNEDYIGGVYRDFEYVKKTMFELIDYFLDYYPIKE